MKNSKKEEAAIELTGLLATAVGGDGVVKGMLAFGEHWAK